jgi:enterochelin esterase-like enzyme
MLKRQDVGKLSQVLILLLLIGLLLSFAASCQPPSTPHERLRSPTVTEPTSAPTQTFEIIQPTSTDQHATPPATTTPDCRQSEGILEEKSFTSDLLEKEFRYIIYLPPCYSETTETGFPVLYLLHGQTYNNDQWLRLGLVDHMEALIAMGDVEPFIIVLPQEAPTEPPQISKFPDIMVGELIPQIDAQYATRPENDFRGIGGLSRGAAWAVQVGFEHPDLFCCIGAHSLPLFQADGGKVTRWLTQNPSEQLPRVFIDIGRSDQERFTAQRFADQLDAAHVAHEWYLFNNGHTEDYWSSHLDLYLYWYAKNW